MSSEGSGGSGFADASRSSISFTAVDSFLAICGSPSSSERGGRIANWPDQRKRILLSGYHFLSAVRVLTKQTAGLNRCTTRAPSP
jgi:hypothetical protein